MRHKNHVSLIGTVGRDAEVRQTQGGVSYARFSLATSSGGYQGRDGQQVPEKTEWHSITAWRELATFCQNYIKKGMKVDVEGMITYGSYKNQQGQDVNITEIVAKDIVLMSMPQQQQGQMNGQQQVMQPAQQQVQQQAQQYQGQQQPFPPQVNGQGMPVNNGQGGGYQPAQYPPGTTGNLPF